MGTPGSGWQNGADGPAGEIGSRSLKGSPRGCGFRLQLSLGLTNLLASCLPCGIERRIALHAPLLRALLAQFVGAGARLPQTLGVFLSFGLRHGHGLAGIFDGAFGQGAALGQHRRQWALHQKLIRNDQHNEEQSRWDRAHQKLSELLKDILHGGTGLLRLLR